MPTLRNALAVAALALTAGAAAGHAQQPGAQATQVMASRADLEALAVQLEQAANSGTYTGDQRARTSCMFDLTLPNTSSVGATNTTGIASSIRAMGPCFNSAAG